MDELIIELLETKLTTADIPPQFRFLHFNLPHNPARYDQECVKLEFESNDWQRLRDQGGCALIFASRILEKLTQIGAYDNSMIFVISDHASTARQQFIEPYGGDSSFFPQHEAPRYFWQKILAHVVI